MLCCIEHYDRGVAVIGTFPDDSHQPIVYPPAKVVRSRNPDTFGVLAFLTSVAARSMFEAYGYTASPTSG
jgi:molybdate transport system substrate-binding protein